MNMRNIVCSVKLYDFERRNMMKESFLTKTGTVYMLNEEKSKLVFLRNDIVKKEFGLTGRELLHNFSNDTLEILNRNGLIVISDDIESLSGVVY